MVQRVLLYIPIALLALALGACGGDGGGEPDAAAGGDIGFLEDCDPDNDLCDRSMELFCFDYNMKGPHCTRECTMDDECEDPSPGCNMRGICRVP